MLAWTFLRTINTAAANRRSSPAIPSLASHSITISLIAGCTFQKAFSQSTAFSNQQNVKFERSLSSDTISPPPAQVVSPPGNPIMRLYQQSKELFAFYKDGIKQLWGNRKMAQELVRKEAQGYTLNRREFQMIRRSKEDTKKLIPFAILVSIAPETIPLFVTIAPGLIPSTCVTASQLEKLRRKRYDQMKADIKIAQSILSIPRNPDAAQPYAQEFATIEGLTLVSTTYRAALELKNLNRRHLAVYCRGLGISSRFHTSITLRKKLERHLGYLKTDDKLIQVEDVNSLSVDTLKHACDERGIRSVDVSETQMRDQLQFWISAHLRDDISAGTLLLGKYFLMNDT